MALPLPKRYGQGARSPSLFRLKPEMADRLIHWLNADPSRLLDLEKLIPQDALRFKMKSDGQYRSLEHLSSARGAVEVLLLLLG